MPSSARTTAPARLPMAALLTLSFTIFVNITVEMLPMGLMLPMSRDLDVSAELVGLLVTVFALTVVLTSSLLIWLTRKVSRKLLVVIVLVVFALSCIGVAVAPGFGAVVALRIAGGLAHGVFWAVVGSYSAYLVPKAQLGRAVAIVNAGGSVAFVLGVPLATLMGQLIGWRWAFAFFGIVSIVAALVVAKVLPAVDHRAEDVVAQTGPVDVVADAGAASGAPPRSQRAWLFPVIAAIVSTTLVMIGQYAVYTHITPYLVEHGGLPETWLSPTLLLYGVVGVVALVLLSIWFGKRPTVEAIVCLLLIVVGMIVLLMFDAPLVVIGAVLLWGFAFGALPPLLQTRAMHVVPARALQPTMALYTTGFNIGIGGGALLGTIVIGAFGFAALPWTLLLSAVAAIALMAFSSRR
ncbi:MFS transporter [Agrococcus casei]|uniref:MFS transporter n=1 Tax=Agrococcus casei TaxID=343512 RepID=UPI003F92E86D